MARSTPDYHAYMPQEQLLAVIDKSYLAKHYIDQEEYIRIKTAEAQLDLLRALQQGGFIDEARVAALVSQLSGNSAALNWLQQQQYQQTQTVATAQEYWFNEFTNVWVKEKCNVCMGKILYRDYNVVRCDLCYGFVGPCQVGDPSITSKKAITRKRIATGAEPYKLKHTCSGVPVRVIYRNLFGRDTVKMCIYNVCLSKIIGCKRGWHGRGDLQNRKINVCKVCCDNKETCRVQQCQRFDYRTTIDPKTRKGVRVKSGYCSSETCWLCQEYLPSAMYCHDCSLAPDAVMQFMIGSDGIKNRRPEVAPLLEECLADIRQKKLLNCIGDVLPPWPEYRTSFEPPIVPATDNALLEQARAKLKVGIETAKARVNKYYEYVSNPSAPNPFLMPSYEYSQPRPTTLISKYPRKQVRPTVVVAKKYYYPRKQSLVATRMPATQPLPSVVAAAAAAAAAIVPLVPRRPATAAASSSSTPIDDDDDDIEDFSDDDNNNAAAAAATRPANKRIRITGTFVVDEDDQQEEEEDEVEDFSDDE